MTNEEIVRAAELEEARRLVSESQCLETILPKTETVSTPPVVGVSPSVSTFPPSQSAPVAELELLNPNRPVKYRKDGEIDRRAFTSARNGNKGQAPEKPMDPDKAVEAAAMVIAGDSLSHALTANGLGQHNAVKIQKLLEITPDEYFNRLGDRLENIIEKLTTRLENETDDISTRDLTLQTAILIDKLSNLRGQKAPTSVHNVQVNINGYSRESALAALSGKRLPVVVNSSAERSQ